MEEQLISFETAKLAKEKGFSINTTEYWEYQASGPERYKFITEDNPGATWVNDDLKNRICISTQSLLQKWLREVHNIYIESQMYIEDGIYKFKYLIKSDFEYDLIILKEDKNYPSYEKALEIGLYQALLLL